MFWVRVIDCCVDDTKQKVDYWLEMDDCHSGDTQEIEATIRYIYTPNTSNFSFKWEIAVPPAEVIEERLHRAESTLYYYQRLIEDYTKQLNNIKTVDRKDN